MPHLYRNSRGGIVEWRTPEQGGAPPATISSRHRQILVTRGRRISTRAANYTGSEPVPLAGTTSSQLASSSISSIYFSITTIASDSQQLSSSSASAIVVGALLAGSPSTQNSSTPSSTIYKTVGLTSTAISGEAYCSSMEISLTRDLVGASCTSLHVSSDNSISLIKQLFSSATVSSPDSSSGVLTLAYILQGAHVSQSNYSEYYSRELDSNTIIYASPSLIEYRDRLSGFTVVRVKDFLSKSVYTPSLSVIRSIPG